MHGRLTHYLLLTALLFLAAVVPPFKDASRSADPTTCYPQSRTTDPSMPSSTQLNGKSFALFCPVSVLLRDTSLPFQTEPPFGTAPESQPKSLPRTCACSNPKPRNPLEAYRTSTAPTAMIAGFTSDERPYPLFAIRRWALGNRGCNAAPGSPAAPGRSARSTPPRSPGCATPAGRWSH